MIHLLPKYKQLIKREKPTEVKITKWSTDTVEALRACFDITDWTVFQLDNGNYDIEAMTDYINFCADCNIPSKTVKCYPNNKPWVTKDLKLLINQKKAAFLANDIDNLKIINGNLKKAIVSKKKIYKQKIEDQLKSNDSRKAWDGLKTITGYKKESNLPNVENNETFANELNDFYSRFDTHDFSKECDILLKQLHVKNDQSPLISIPDVNSALSKIKTRKAPGPDRVSGKVLKECRLQLAPTLRDIFQHSIDNHYLPLPWKTSEIVPVPKMSLPLVKNDLRPVALTSLIMKTFERIVLKFLNPNNLVDSLQFAYRESRSVEDATLFLINAILSHLDKERTYARAMFIDFSSAFNTIQPHLMLEKLMAKNVNSKLIIWIHKFLTGRKQYVRFRDAFSNCTTINTGAPQGCVLSASLFTIYESDNGTDNEKCIIIKYADDTVILGLLGERDNHLENFYTYEIDRFNHWCKDNFLDLNVKKTKEMIIDFRINKPTLEPIKINDVAVDVVKSYKYLGSIVDNELNGNENIEKVYKKANQRMYFVRKLKKCDIDKTIMSMFYKSVVESVIIFGLLNWYGGSSSEARGKVKRIITSARRLGCTAPSLEDLHLNLMEKKCKHILSDPSHPLRSNFEELPSECRLRTIYCRTERFRRSFVPAAVRLLNK